MGRIEEQTDLLDEVPGRHDQGGRSQARFQRHIEEHVGRHLKHAADVLLRFHKRRGFDHLIVAGPEEVIPEFERTLHDYVRRRIVARVSLPMTATAEDVLEQSLGVEERLEAERERETLERLKAESAAGRQAVLGLTGVLDALNDGRVDTLVVSFGFRAEGVRCSSCGLLAAGGRRCRTCRGSLQPVRDVVESAVAAALRQNARVETLSYLGPEQANGHEVGALLRY
jgi:peptide chain release factor subunit 1